MKCAMCSKEIKGEDRMSVHEACEDISNARFRAKQCKFCGEYIGNIYVGANKDIEISSDQHCPDRVYVGYS